MRATLLRLFPLWLGLLLAGCAGPATSLRTQVTDCAGFFRAPDGYSLPAMRTPAGAPGPIVNILVLSGGGKYGAYGAGFLKGWLDAERDGRLPEGGLRLSDVTIVTGISTGAMLQTFISVATLGGEGGRAAIEDAHGIYTSVSDSQLVKKRGLVQSLRSNAITDPAHGLQPLLDNRIARYWPRLAAMPAGRQSIAGIVNLDNGAFYAVDLLEIARSGKPNARACYREVVLASSAVPVGFPPRFIDGSGYVDGGVRFGAFLAEPLAEALADMGRAGTPPRVNLRVIMNNTLSPNNPEDNATQALACDRSTALTAASACAPVKNELLPIAFRAAGDILVAQVYRDSVYRLQRELEAGGMLESSGFTFVPNAAIAAAGCKRTTSDNFDTAFMQCLARIGYAQGYAQAWLPFEETPSEMVQPTR